jgi:phage repressor protein C with HTH and peptisase S24 domain
MGKFNLLSERLEWAVKQKEETDRRRIFKAELAAIAKVSRASVTNWFKDENGIGGANARPLAEFLGVNPIWLESGQGHPSDGIVNIKEILHNKSRANDGAFELPLFRDVIGSMGKGVVLRDQPGQITTMRVTEEWLQKNVPRHSGKDNLCVITGFGDSMLGMFNSGDPLLVDAGVRSCDHDGVYFFKVGLEGFVKRLQRIPGQGIRVISENKKYESWTITEDMDFHVMAKVIKVWQGTNF